MRFRQVLKALEPSEMFGYLRQSAENSVTSLQCIENTLKRSVAFGIAVKIGLLLDNVRLANTRELHSCHKSCAVFRSKMF